MSDASYNFLASNMHDIVKTENDRLLTKKEIIDKEYEGKQRLGLLNDNTRKRNEEFSKILIAFVIVLCIFTLLRLAAKKFDYVPDYVFEIPNFILVAIAIIYIFTIFFRIIGRDRLYYDKLIFEKPTLDSPEEIQKNHDSVVRNAARNDCVAEVCCDPTNNIVYDAISNKCVVSTTSTFTTMKLSYVIPPTIPNHPNEFEQYTKI